MLNSVGPRCLTEEFDEEKWTKIDPPPKKFNEPHERKVIIHHVIGPECPYCYIVAVNNAEMSPPDPDLLVGWRLELFTKSLDLARQKANYLASFYPPKCRIEIWYELEAHQAIEGYTVCDCERTNPPYGHRNHAETCPIVRADGVLFGTAVVAL